MWYSHPGRHCKDIAQDARGVDDHDRCSTQGIQVKLKEVDARTLTLSFRREALHLPAYLRQAHDITEYMAEDGWPDGRRSEKQVCSMEPEKSGIAKLENCRANCRRE
jgi:hypothetical protein